MKEQKHPPAPLGAAIWLQLSTVFGLLAAIAFVIYGWRQGIFTSQESMKAFLQSFGLWAPLLFIAIQVIQVVIPVLPGGISCLAGVVLFGALQGFLYNYIGICIGSLLAFLLAKHYGKPLVRTIAGESRYEKYSKWLEGNGKFDRFFAAAIFFPVAPDDLLCYLAGLTRMSVKKFTAIILLAKPASIALYSMGLLLFSRTMLHLL